MWASVKSKLLCYFSTAINSSSHHLSVAFLSRSFKTHLISDMLHAVHQAFHTALTIIPHHICSNFVQDIGMLFQNSLRMIRMSVYDANVVTFPEHSEVGWGDGICAQFICKSIHLIEKVMVA